MGIVFRQSVKTTIVTFIGVALGAYINYIYVFVFTQRELGFYTNTINIGAVMQLFVMMGMGSVLSVFIPRYGEDLRKKKSLITLGFIVTSFAIVLTTIIGILFRKQFIGLYKIPDQQYLYKYYYYIFLLIGLWGIASLVEQFLVSQIKIALSAFVREVLLRLCNLLIIALYYFKVINFNSFVVLSVLIYAIPVIVLLFTSIKTGNFGFSFNFKVFSKVDYKEITHYAWYHLLFGLSINLFGFLDLLLLAVLDKSGFESLSIYRNAIFVTSVMIVPFRAMSASAFSIINKSYIGGNREELDHLFKRSGLNILIVVGALMGIILVNLDNLVAILPQAYNSIKPVIIILMIGKFTDVITGLNNEVISISKYYKFNFRSSGLLLLAIFAFDFVLIPKYGIYGAAWGTTLAYTLINLIKLFFLWNKLQLQPFSKGTLMSLLSIVVATISAYLIPKCSNPFLDTFIRSVILLGIYSVLLLWLKPSEDLQNYLISIKTNKRLF